MEKSVRLLRPWHLAASIGVCALLAAPVLVYVAEFGTQLSPDHQRWGTFGDFVGGVLNPVLGLLNLGVVAYLTVVAHRALRSEEREHERRAREEQWNHELEARQEHRNHERAARDDQRAFEQDHAREQHRVALTLRLIDDWHAMLMERIRADKFLGGREPGELRSLTALYDLAPEVWHPISRVRHFWAQVGVLKKAGRLDDGLAREFLAGDAAYWWKNHFQSLEGSEEQLTTWSETWTILYDWLPATPTPARDTSDARAPDRTLAETVALRPPNVG